MLNIFKKSNSSAYSNLTAEAFNKILKETPNVILLDVRTPAEFSQSKIPGAINLDINGKVFYEEVQKLDKGKVFLVYCRSGARSAQACEYMSENNFLNLNNLEGGLIRWPFDKE